MKKFWISSTYSENDCYIDEYIKKMEKGEFVILLLKSGGYDTKEVSCFKNSDLQTC